MSMVAETLCQAREAQNLSVYQVAEVTKIRTDHIRALDEGNWDVFAAPVYIRGFVRSYAGMLKLDVPQVMAMLDRELAGSDKHSEPPPLSDQPSGIVDWAMYRLSKVHWRFVLPVLLVIAVLGGSVLVWRAWSSAKARDPLQDLGPGLYQPPRPANGDTLPVPAPPR
jgi:cytoskeleton protein RodZ